MCRSFTLGIALCALALLAACEKQPGASAPPEVSSATAPPPIPVTTKSGVEAVYLPGGQFTMGASDGNPDEAPPHKVTVTGFLIDKLEVTHEMFAKVELPDPSHWQENPKTPVERIRWRDAKGYCNERSRQEGLEPCYNEKTVEWDCNYSATGYRLPTEAEWEYAARAGSDTAYDFGSADKLRQYAWYAENADQKTHAVGQKKPNAWGLYDIDGNVSEWCEDVYSPTFYQESPATDPTGPPSPGKDVKRVMRGGNWNASAEMCRVTARRGERTGNTDACFATDFCGFRCVRRATPEEVAQWTRRVIVLEIGASAPLRKVRPDWQKQSFEGSRSQTLFGSVLVGKPSGATSPAFRGNPKRGRGRGQQSPVSRSGTASHVDH